MTLRGWLALLVSLAAVLALCVSSATCGAIAVGGAVVLWLDARLPFSGDFNE